MDETSISVPDWDNHTVLHPLGLLGTLVLGAATLMVPRKYAVWPMIFLACLISPAQRVVIAGLDFSLLRLMILFGWFRLFSRKETGGLVWKPIDTLVVIWLVVRTIAYTALLGTFSDFVYCCGFILDAGGLYFLIRFLVRDWTDFQSIVVGWIVASIPVALAFMVERTTGHNAFAVFGGLPSVTVMRDGKFRCQGAFPHPIIAGCFWAGLMPLMASHWWSAKKGRGLAILGLVNAAIIVAACNSSTPTLGVLCAVVGALMFPLRRSMRPVRWLAVLTLFGLHMVMKAPVWHLIARIDVVGGSTGWHRYYLIDQTIKHFSDWWLMGVDLDTIKSTWGDELTDLTNEYVYEAVQGGLLTLLLFCGYFAMAFKGVGQMWRSAGNNRPQVIMAWSLGVALFVHMMNFLAVSYFGQILLVWYSNLAIIASLTPTARAFAAQGPAVSPRQDFDHRERARRTATSGERRV
jgi:hypothetical protein